MTDFQRRQFRTRGLEPLLSAVAKANYVDPSEVLSQDRHRAPSRARRELAYYLHAEYGFSYSEVGILLARDHTTIVHAVRKHEAERGLLFRASEAG